MQLRTEGDQWNGFLTDLSGQFDAKVTELNKAVKEALEAIKGDSSDAKTLAKYQSVSAEYQTYRQTQSSVVKSYKDVATGIIANFR